MTPLYEMSQEIEESPPAPFPKFLPTDRIRKIIVDWLEQNVTTDRACDEGWNTVAHRTGVALRRIYAIRHEEGATTRWSTVDQIIQGLDLTDLLHLPPEMGGLADWYAPEDGVLPPLPRPNAEQKTRLRASRDRKRRAKERRTAQTGSRKRTKVAA